LDRYDVLVVGGGPVGAHTAAVLAGSGFRVAVLEKRTNLNGQVCCTGLVSSECLERYPVEPALILNRLNKALLVSPAGRQIVVERSQIQACAIDRQGYDRWMAEQAVAAGADYFYGHQVKQLNMRAEGVSTEVESGGNLLIFQSRSAVLACGFGSPLVGQAGMGKAGDWKMGVQADVELLGETGVEIHLGSAYAPGSFAWLVPLEARRGLMGLMARRDVKKHFERFRAKLEAEGRIAGGTLKPRFRGITIKPPARTFAERVLLVGDAAGQVKPISGGGIYYGLMCADLAAECLKFALAADDLSARRLSSYQRAWRGLLGREISTSYLAQRMYGGLSDLWLERFFSMAQKRGLFSELAASEKLGFDWHSQVIMQVGRRFVFNR
jgi:geranylgeranyl reductase family protein